MRALKFTFLLVCILAVILCIVTVIWSSNKGFDLSDEGYYITGYNHLIENTFGQTSFHFLTNRTLSRFGTGLIFFRIARLFLTIISSLFLSFSFFKWLTKFSFIKKENSKTTLISLNLFCLIGSFVSYGLGPQTLSYNHYTLIFGNLFLGLLFLAFTFSYNVKKVMFISAAIGIILGLEFFIKIPTFILFSFIFLCFQIILIKKLRWFALINTLLFVVFATLIFTIISFPLKPLYVLQEYFYVISTLSEQLAHGVSEVLVMYKAGVYDLWDSHLLNYVPYLICLLISLFISFQNRFITIKQIGKFIFLFILLFMIYSFYEKSYFWAGSNHISSTSLIYIIWIFLFSTLFIFFLTKRRRMFISKFFFEKLFLILILLFFPIICSFGTGNYLHVHIVFFLNTWFLMIYLVYLFSGLEKPNIITISIYVLLITVVIKSSFDVVSALVIDPYRVKGHLWEQTEALKIKSTNETIFIHKELMNSITLIENSLTDKNKEALLISSELNGLGYVFNKTLVGYGWYDCGRSSRDFFCQAYNQSKYREKNKIYFIFNSVDNNCKVFECFSDGKINLKSKILSWNNDSLFVYENHD